MAAARKKPSAKRAVRKASPARRVILFPTERSTIGLKKIETMVATVIARRSPNK